MRSNYVLLESNNISVFDLENSCILFYKKYGVYPTLIKLSSYDMHDILSVCPPANKLSLLDSERVHLYKYYYNLPPGPVLLEFNDEDTTVINGSNNANSPYRPQRFIILENRQLDQEFEKVVLNG